MSYEIGPILSQILATCPNVSTIFQSQLSQFFFSIRYKPFENVAFEQVLVEAKEDHMHGPLALHSLNFNDIATTGVR